MSKKWKRNSAPAKKSTPAESVVAESILPEAEAPETELQPVVEQVVAPTPAVVSEPAVVSAPAPAEKKPEPVDAKPVVRRSLRESTGAVGSGNTTAGRIFDIFNYIFLTLVALTTIAPFIYIIGASFATELELSQRPLLIIPHNPTTGAYEYIFSTNKILSGFANSAFITVAGTLINLFFTVTMAYAISKPRLRGRNFILNMVIFSMFFGGGMIPSYIVVANMLNLKDTYWSVLLPGAISAYNMMIVKNFFQGIPQELEESASMDGCTDIGILWKIVLPLSLPVLATFGLFYAVGHWNAYFGAMIYMSGAREKWPLQVLLREIIILSNASAGDMANMDPEFVQPPEQSVKMAVIVVSTVPIMCIYPFLQKYFVKGVMVGALKG